MKTVPILTAIMVATLALTGCSMSAEGSATNPVERGWTKTEIGDVLCSWTTASKVGTVTDCDWSTLTSRGERTGDADEQFGGGWFYFDGREDAVFCLVFRRGLTDCNW